MNMTSAAIGRSIALAVLVLAVACGAGGSAQKGHASAKRVLYYVDPMHPTYRSDKPGTAPDCGMALEAVYENDAPATASGPASGAVSIGADKQRLTGILVETIERKPGGRSVRTTGRVEVDGDRLHRLMAGADGWVQSVQNNPVGTLVKKDELLATLYSREFRNAQQAYLGSLVSLDRMKGGREPQDEPTKGSDASLRINEDQLRALGMGDAQIRELRAKRQITSEITVNAPGDGIVIKREISPGQRFEPGNEFYRIANLSRVWIVADVLGEDSSAFPPGAKVSVLVRDRNLTVQATVSNTPPYFDAESRTWKLRLDAENPGFALRPGMFVDIELPVPGAPALTVPLDALLDSGLSERVFVETAEGEFEPRTVKTGWRSGDRVEIVAGLAEGDRVVARGTFLVDSESRLKTR
jgi:Cu(I)/Ag(I) efflux system membrane fusion protein